MSAYPEVQSTQQPSGQLASPENVLSFWFGPPGTNEDEMTRIRRWFRGGAPMDEEVARHFGPSVEAALRHDLDGWAATTRGRLALVLLLDQMARSLYRNDPRSYAGDAQAQALSAQAFDRDMHLELDFPERMFLAMPMAHAEDMALQERVAQLANDLAANVPPTYRAMTAMMVEQTAKRTDRTDKAATDHYILRNYATLELCVLAEHKRDAMHVALNLAIEMKLTIRCHVAGDC